MDKDFENTCAELIQKAQKLVQKENPALASFIADLFHHGLSEDIVRYSAEDLVKFAKACFDHIQSRKPKQPVLKLTHHEIQSTDTTTTPVKMTTIDVLNDNMPFLIDSVVPAIRELGFEILLFVHPIFTVHRDAKGKLLEPPKPFKPDGSSQALRESVLHIHVGEVSVSEAKAIKSTILSVLKDVRGIVDDWLPMTNRLESTIRLYKSNPPPLEVTQLAEALQFLEWLMDNNFTFLGIREMRFDENAERFVQPVKGSGLGILRNPDVHVLKRRDELVEITPEIREFMTSTDPLIISKANVRSRVHRQTYMDYIGVKLYDAMGYLTGELRMVGLFTSTVYARSIRTIPYVRHKAVQVVENAGYDANSHSGKALWNVLESYPRDELFQISVEQLEEFSLSVLALDGRSRVRVLPRFDKFDRYVSVLVFVPRDRYNTDVRMRIGDYLKTALDGRVSAFYPGFPEGLLARVHFIIGRNLGAAPAVSRAELETAIETIIETWEDRLKNSLSFAGEPEGSPDYLNGFSAAYREAYTPRQAVGDIRVFLTLKSDDKIAVEIYRRTDVPEHCLGLKLYHLLTPIELSRRVPMLENLGFRVINERTYKVSPTDQPARFMHDMTLETNNGAAIDIKESKTRLEEAYLSIWDRQAGNDGYNALITYAGLNWRDVALLRTISRYLQQIGVTYSQEYMWQALNRNPTIAADIAALFHARFDPKTKSREKLQKQIFHRLDEALEQVASLDEDQIIRRFRSVIMGAVRTNFFKVGKDNKPLPEISLKLAPREIEGVPAPRPFREIFMTSPRVEGLHLRFGKVARGGLRWSDRPEDFRTEVLGLVKAQQVKNAVIVPVGSKGGFVPKKLEPGMNRDEFIQTGTDAYKIFISNLLEITDNLDGDTVIHPQNVVRHEEDDPYLVVAADKGTATFSDTANGISQDYDFWLDDAFASGGSAGYDHKKMGITARGAWEAVKRHFREMDKDIQTEPFTVAGVGDMSGDVFGNGMLLSKATKLVAAFDHRDIFLDPDPDPASSFAERQRLFDLGRSSWQDYDTSLLSKGGGIFSRSAKSIELSSEIQKLLGIKRANLNPFELMQAILKMNVELFWFGGIGTYVRGPHESDADVGDRANDAIRIEAAELGAKVVGEGANLGMTQRARIAYNKRGGRSNSDAIDNSAGVNSSDLEVNIKIALGSAMRSGKLTLSQRNTLLGSMTDDVAALCLRNNYQQTLSISLTQMRGMEDFGHQSRYMQALENRGLLDRKVENLPLDPTLDERKLTGEPLTRAEIGVILAYAKITLFDDLLASDVLEDEYLTRELMRYFPEKMQKKYEPEILSHKLRREIVATVLSNTMINRGGATYLERVSDQTGRSTAAMARAYIVARDAFSLQNVNGEIDALDTKIPGELQLELYTAVQNLLISQTVKILRQSHSAEGLEAQIRPIANGVENLKPELVAMLPKYLKTSYEKRLKTYLQAKVPAALADHIALLPVLDLVPDIVTVCEASSRPLHDAAKVFFDIAGTFRIGKIDFLAQSLETTDYYEGMAVERTRFQLANTHRKITLEALKAHSGPEAATAWCEARTQKVAQVQKTIQNILEESAMSVAKLAVAANLIDDLTAQDVRQP